MVTASQTGPIPTAMETAAHIGLFARPRIWNVLRVVLGLLLLAAAGLKLAGQGVSAVPQVGWFSRTNIQFVAAQWEIVIGLWLLSGASQAGSWVAAIGTFFSFAVISGYLGWAGESSCGCLGVIKASPWYLVGTDLVVIVSLAIVRPSFARPGPAIGGGIGVLRANVIRVLVLSGCLMAAASGAATLAYGGIGEAIARLRGERVSALPSSVDFGIVEPGEVRDKSVVLRNRTNQAVRIVGVNADCSCRLRDLPVHIPPSDSATITITIRVPNTPATSFTRQILLMTDDGLQPLVALQYHGRVSPH